MKLWIATTNPGKLREFALFGGDGFSIEPLSGIPPVEETGSTFEENAVLKARHYGPHASGLLIAEDSGLEVDALGGAPGVYSARFAGPAADDAANNRLLVDRLRGIENRTARYVCAIALVQGDEWLGTFRGEVDGRIVDEPRGSNGFGYDPHFFYPPYDCTFAEADPARKREVSHRGRAARAMFRFIQSNLLR